MFLRRIHPETHHSAQGKAKADAKRLDDKTAAINRELQDIGKEIEQLEAGDYPKVCVNSKNDIRYVNRFFRVLSLRTMTDVLPPLSLIQGFSRPASTFSLIQLSNSRVCVFMAEYAFWGMRTECFCHFYMYKMERLAYNT